MATFRALLDSQVAHEHTGPDGCPACVQLLHQATELYHGNFLAGLAIPDSPPFEEWHHSQQEQLHIQTLDSLSLLADLYAAGGADAQAQQCARRQLQLEPWREIAHQQLMRALARSSQRAAAIGQYRACHQILEAELGIAPDATTIALYEQIRNDRLARQPGGQAPPAAASPDPAWHGVPETGPLYGRAAELARLQGWLAHDRARVVAVLGMGGIGKTALAAAAAGAAGAHYDAVIWHSLLNAPPLSDILRATLQALLGHPQPALPASLDEQLALLLAELRRRRCLLVVDNLESILDSRQAGAYRAGCERPNKLAGLEADALGVHSLRLAGLDPAAAQALIEARGLPGQAVAAGALAAHYSGNPLALKLVAQTVRELFGGDINAFLATEAPIFGAIRAVLDQQFARLSDLEREILTWLAIEREPTSMPALRANLVDAGTPRDFVEALRALQRRSLLEQAGSAPDASPAAPPIRPPEQGAGAAFFLQHVIMEHATDRLVEEVCREIADGRPDLLNRHALFKAHARAYVRQSQERRILQPIAERLVARLGQAGLEAQLRHLLATLRSHAVRTPGYAADNILNLLLHLGVDLRGYDFSQFSVWQAYLRGAALPEVNFSQADLAGSVFSDSFGSVYAVALSPDGERVAAGTASGEIRMWQVADGQPYLTLQGHTGTVWSVCFSPDGRILASVGDDQTVRLWDVATGQRLATLLGHSAVI